MAKKKASNIALWIIMGLLIVGLAGFGATNFGSSASTVATVGSTDVTMREYANAIREQIDRFERQTGQRLTPQQAQALGLTRVALSGAVADAALAHEASELGISVGDRAVADEITRIGAFQGADGFDRTAYQVALRNAGLTVRDFERNVRRDLTTDLLRRAVTGGITTPDVFATTLFEYARQERDVTWARLTAEDLPEPISEPTDDDLRTYYESNPEPFTRPESRQITYAALMPEDLVDEITVDEDQLRTEYEARIAEFVEPERRLVERLVFANDEAANDAKARLDSGGATFDALVGERGLTLSDIDLGDVSEVELGAAGRDVFALDEPGVVGPLPSDLGPALYRMNGILAAEEISFEEAREGLRRDIALERAARAISDQITEVEDLLAGGADMATLAERTDMKMGEILWNEEVFDGIASDPDFAEAAASTEPGAFPEVYQTADGGIFALTVEEVLPPALRPLDEVREDARAAWREAEQQAALTARAEALAEEIRGGADLRSLEIDFETERNVGRNAFIEGTPPGFNEAVFAMEEGEVRVLSADGDAWLIRLDTVTLPDATSPESQVILQRFSSETAADLAGSIGLAFTNAVLEQTDVTIDQAAVAAVETGIQ